MGFDSGSEVLPGGDPNGFPNAILVPNSGFAGWSQQAVVATRSYFNRFVASQSFVCGHISFNLIVAAGSNDNCDVGLYTSAGVLLSSAGSTAGKLNGAANSIQTLPLLTPIQLVAGQVYFAAFASGPIGTTAAQIIMDGIPGNLMQIFGATLPNQVHSFVGVFPLGANFGVSGPIANCPILGLSV